MIIKDVIILKESRKKVKLTFTANDNKLKQLTIIKQVKSTKNDRQGKQY